MKSLRIVVKDLTKDFERALFYQRTGRENKARELFAKTIQEGYHKAGKLYEREPDAGYKVLKLVLGYEHQIKNER